ncbi:unnamed protein product [Arabidopsis lyrata]|nr:unnamed protein product [Arabidopsis lyrata]
MRRKRKERSRSFRSRVRKDGRREDEATSIRWALGSLE